MLSWNSLTVDTFMQEASEFLINNPYRDDNSMEQVCIQFECVYSLIVTITVNLPLIEKHHQPIRRITT